MSTIRIAASGPSMQRRSERQHVRAVVLAGSTARSVSFAHIAARTPRTLFAAIAEPMPAPSMTIPASTLPSRDASRDRPGNIGIVYRVGRVCAHVERRPCRARADGRRARASAQRRCDRCRWPRGDVGDGRQIARAATHRRSRRERRSRGAPPACLAPAASRGRRGQLDGRPRVDRPRVGLGDDVESFHDRSPVTSAFTNRTRSAPRCTAGSGTSRRSRARSRRRNDPRS